MFLYKLRIELLNVFNEVLIVYMLIYWKYLYLMGKYRFYAFSSWENWINPVLTAIIEMKFN